MGLVGRRETIRAPTVGYASDSTPVSTAKLVSTATPRPSLSLVGMGISPVRKSSMRASAISTTHTAPSDQASQAAVRWLIPPAPYPASLSLASHPRSATRPSPGYFDNRYGDS